MPETFSTVILIDPGGQAAAAHAAIAAQAEKHRVETKKLATELAGALKSINALKEQVKRTGDEHKDAAAKVARFARQQKLINKVMRETGASAATAGKVVRAYGKDLDRAEKEAVEAARALDRLTKKTRELTSAQRASAGTTSTLGRTVKAAGVAVLGFAAAYIGVQAVIRATTALVRGSVDAFADLQDAVVSLRKVTDGLGDAGLSSLVERLEQLSTTTVPIATEELIELAAVAGQLGIATEEGLANAAETGAKLAQATDLAGADAIKGLARILSIQGESIDAIDNLGAALVELGNTSKATESEIAPIANEIARSTANFDIASPTILGFAAALAEMGAKAEGSGSALSELFQALLVARETGEGLDDLAKIAGVATAEFEDLTRNDLTKAVLTFLDGLGKKGERGIIALDGVGLASKRTAKALLPLAANADRLADRLAVANKAFIENVALDKEAAAAFSTLRADAQRLQNSLRLLLAEGFAPLAGPVSGLLQDAVKLIEAWRDYNKVVERSPELAVAYALAVELILRPIRELLAVVTALPRLLVFMSDTFGITEGESERLAGTLDDVAKSLDDVGGSIGGVETAASDLTAAQMDKGMRDTLGETEKLSEALQKLQAQAVKQKSVALAMDSLGVSAQEAAQIVGTLTEIQEEAGLEGLAAAEAVRDLLAEGDDASVLAVRDLVVEISTATDEANALAGALEAVAAGALKIREVIPAPDLNLAALPGGGLPGLQQLGPQGTPIVDEATFGTMTLIRTVNKADEEFDDLALAAAILQDSFGGLDGVVGALANAMPQIIDGLKSIQSGQPGGKKDFAAGAINAVSGSLGFVGQRGPGEHGERRSGDFSDVGRDVGAIVGTIVPVIGTALGAALGELLGGLFKSGADELLIQFSQVRDDFTSTITKAQGPLGGLGDDISGFIGEIFSNLESAIGGEIDIQASDIVGGQGISGEGVAAALKFRDGMFIAFVSGMREEFEEASEAIGFITLELLKNAEFGAAISDNVKAALTADAESLEQLEERIAFALGIDKMLADLGPVAAAIAEINALYAAEAKQARELGIEELQLLQIKDKRLAALRAEVEGELRSVLGITDHAAILEDLNRASTEFNAGIEEERQLRLADIEVLKEQQAAIIASNEAVDLATEGAGIFADGMDDFFIGMLDGTEGMAGFVAGGRDFAAGLESSADAIARTDAEIQALEESLAGLPDAIDTELLEQAFNRVALSAVDELQQVFSQVEGFSLDSQAAEALRHLVFMDNIAQTIAGLELMLLTSTTLTDAARQALEEAVAEGNRLLGGLTSGEVTIGQAAGGGGGASGGRRQAREGVLDFFAGLGRAASGASDGMKTLTDSLEEFRDAEKEAARLGKVGAEVIEQAFRDFLTVSAQAAVEGLEDVLDAVREVGLFEAALREQTATFVSAREQLTLLIQLAEQQGESTDALIDQRRELVEAEQLAAQQLVATNLVDELAALGVSLDPAILERMAEGERELAEQRAISSVMAAAEAGLLEGVDIPGLIRDITESFQPDILAAELASLDLRAVAEEWSATAREMRQSGVESAIRGVRDRFEASREEARASRDADPAGFRETMRQIRAGLRVQLREIGRDAIASIAGPLQSLRIAGRESVRDIIFLVDHLDNLGLTARQVARTVRGAVLPGLLDVAIAEAERVGDLDRAVQLQRQKDELATAMLLLQVEIWEQMLIAAGAMNDNLQRIIDDIRLMAELPDAIADATEDAVERVGDSPARATTTVSSGEEFIEDSRALLRAIEDFVFGFEQIDAARFTAQANEWLRTVENFQADAAAAFASTGFATFFSQVSELALGASVQLGDASKEQLESFLAFARAQGPGSAFGPFFDEIELALAALDLEGSISKGAASLIRDFSGPLADSVPALEALNAEYQDLLTALDLLGASEAEIISAEEAFHALRMKLLDEQAGGLRDLLAETEAAILASRAPREQLVAAKREFEAASAGADLNDPASVQRLENAVRAYQDVAARYDELLGVSITASVNDAVAAALGGLLDPAPRTGDAPTLPAFQSGGLTGPAPILLPPEIADRARPFASAPTSDTVGGVADLTSEVREFRLEAGQRWTEERTLRMRTVDALEERGV